MWRMQLEVAAQDEILPQEDLPALTVSKPRSACYSAGERSPPFLAMQYRAFPIALLFAAGLHRPQFHHRCRRYESQPFDGYRRPSYICQSQRFSRPHRGTWPVDERRLSRLSARTARRPRRDKSSRRFREGVLSAIHAPEGLSRIPPAPGDCC